MFLIMYLVIVESVSIVFKTTDVLDVIFNCLAMTFLLEINDKWLSIITKVMRFSSMEEAQFYLMDVWTDEGDIRDEFYHDGQVGCGGCFGEEDRAASDYKRYVQFCMWITSGKIVDGESQTHTVLRRGQGAGVVEQLIT